MLSGAATVAGPTGDALRQQALEAAFTSTLRNLPQSLPACGR
jgi:hypothetical protein